MTQFRSHSPAPPNATLRRLATASGRVVLLLLLFLGGIPSPGPAAEVKTSVIVVVGAAGDEAYQESFATWAGRWQEAAKRGDARTVMVGAASGDSTNALVRFREVIASESRSGPADLWIVFIGHGTFDGKEAKFNLEGEDLSAVDLVQLLNPVDRRMAVILSGSSSAPFIAPLSANGRSILTATRSGSENNFARYGDFLSSAVGDPESDLDKDGQVSLLEAHLTASKKVGDFYALDGRLATEHSLLDDNGDGLGTPSDWFRGIRATKKARDGAEPDGLRAHQLCLIPNEADRQLSPEARRERDALELEIARLRERKVEMDEAEYYKALEPLLLSLGKLYHPGSPKTRGATQ